MGGLGVRSVALLAPSAFLASAAGTRDLQDKILPVAFPDQDEEYLRIQGVWSETSGVSAPSEGASLKRQSSWDSAVCQRVRNSLMSNATDSHTRARLLAVSAELSSDWLHALPLSACGLRMDDNTIRISVGLRLGAKLCEPHSCVCGADVDILGHHGLVCNKSAGRSSRHNYINDLIWRVLIVPEFLPSRSRQASLAMMESGLTDLHRSRGRQAGASHGTSPLRTLWPQATLVTPHSLLELLRRRRPRGSFRNTLSCLLAIPLFLWPLRPLAQLIVWAQSLSGTSGLELGALQEMYAKVASCGSDCRWLFSGLMQYIYKTRLRP